MSGLGHTLKQLPLSFATVHTLCVNISPASLIRCQPYVKGSWSVAEQDDPCVYGSIAAFCSRQVGHGSMEAAFELLHMFLEEPVWDAEALKRAKTHYVNNKGTMSKSLEKATAERIMQVNGVLRGCLVPHA